MGAGVRVALDDRIGASAPVDCDMLAVNDALDALARLDPRQAQIVELRYFGGLSEQEVAAVCRCRARRSRANGRRRVPGCTAA